MKIFIELLPHEQTAVTADSYAVCLEDGEILVESTRHPLREGARALQKRGVTGRVEMWDRVRPYPRMMGNIEQLAKEQLIESKDRRTFSLVPWTEFPSL